MKLKNIVKPFLLVGICAIVGFLLLLLVYSIPVSKMEESAFESVIVFDVEGDCPTEHYSTRMQDNYTDALMLSEAIYSGEEGLVERTVQTFYRNVPGKNTADSFVDMHSGQAVETERVDYARYWHGYLLFLKPLFTVFNYTQIRVINSIIQFALLLTLMYIIGRKAPAALFPFAFLVVLLAPTAIAKCMHYSSVYYVMLFTSIVLLLNPKRVFDDGRVFYLFMMAGILTAFLDLLSAPTISLTVPLVFLCLNDREISVAHKLKRQLHSVCAWFFGYAAMWGSKWIITMLSGDMNFLRTILDVVLFRTSATNVGNESIARIGTLQYGIYELLSRHNIKRFILVYIVFLLLVFLIRKRKLSLGDIGAVLPFMVPVALIVLWVLLLSNHTVVHVLFAYRTLAPIVFSALTYMSCVAEKTA